MGRTFILVAHVGTKPSAGIYSTGGFAMVDPGGEIARWSNLIEPARSRNETRILSLTPTFRVDDEPLNNDAGRRRSLCIAKPFRVFHETVPKRSRDTHDMSACGERCLRSPRLFAMYPERRLDIEIVKILQGLNETGRSHRPERNLPSRPSHRGERIVGKHVAATAVRAERIGKWLTLKRVTRCP